MVADPLLQLLHFGGHAVTAVATAVLAYWVVARTEVSSKRWFVLWMGNFSVWSVVAAALVVVTHQPTAFVLFWLWAVVGLTAIYLTYLFPTAFAGRNPLTNRVCRLSGIIYIGLLMLVLTGPRHQLYWQSVSFLQSPFPHFTVDYGPGWLLAVAYSVGAVGVFLYSFAMLYFRSRRYQRRAIVVLATGTLLSLVVTGLSQSDILLVRSYDYYAFTGATESLAIGYAALRFGSENLSAVARNEALDYLVDPYLALDTRYRIVDYNDASSRLIDGLTSDQLGEPLEVVFPELANRLLTPSGIADPDEPITVVADGTTKHYAVSLASISDWNSTRCYAVVLNDVTELEQSRHRIEQQNEQLDAFAGTVSHDLRSPLSVIAGRVALAQRDADSEHLDHIEQARARMEALIDDLLTLAREGQTVGDREPVDLAALVSDCWQTVDTAQATIRTETDRTVVADRSRLRQLLENILRNAIEHGSTENRHSPSADEATTHGGAGVSITVGDLETGFYIEDDGPGIPESDREAVFDTGYSTDENGTGFGLAIVTQIVEAHGWEISVTEGSAGGARFEITDVESAQNPSTERSSLSTQ